MNISKNSLQNTTAKTFSSTCYFLSIEFLISHERELVETFSSSAQVEIQVKIQYRTFFIFEQNFSNFGGFHGVVLVKTFPLMYQLLM